VYKPSPNVSICKKLVNEVSAVLGLNVLKTLFTV
jgi:hypothetical protein